MPRSVNRHEGVHADPSKQLYACSSSSSTYYHGPGYHYHACMRMRVKFGSSTDEIHFLRWQLRKLKNLAPSILGVASRGGLLH